MKRAIIAGLVLALVAGTFIMGQYWSSSTDQVTTAAVAQPEDRFVELLDPKANTLLAERRRECGNNQLGADAFDRALGEFQAEAQSEGYVLYQSELLFIGDHLVHEKSVLGKCLVLAVDLEEAEDVGYQEALTMVLMSTDGDKVLGRDGKAATSWQQIVADGTWRPSSLVIENGEMFLIALPETTGEEMQDVAKYETELNPS
jgi:hypothetical protein